MSSRASLFSWRANGQWRYNAGMSGELNRRWWQFRLSTVLLLNVVIAVMIAWWMDHTRLQRQFDDAKRRIQFLETSQYFDGDLQAVRR